MKESVSPWRPTFNGSVRVERTTSDSGALLLREALVNSGVIAALEDHLADRRDPHTDPAPYPRRGRLAGDWASRRRNSRERRWWG
jgi:hypothetical protein